MAMLAASLLLLSGAQPATNCHAMQWNLRLGPGYHGRAGRSGETCREGGRAPSVAAAVTAAVPPRAKGRRSSSSSLSSSSRAASSSPSLVRPLMRLSRSRCAPCFTMRSEPPSLCGPLPSLASPGGFAPSSTSFVCGASPGWYFVAVHEDPRMNLPSRPRIEPLRSLQVWARWAPRAQAAHSEGLSLNALVFAWDPALISRLMWLQVARPSL